MESTIVERSRAGRAPTLFLGLLLALLGGGAVWFGFGGGSAERVSPAVPSRDAAPASEPGAERPRADTGDLDASGGPATAAVRKLDPAAAKPADLGLGRGVPADPTRFEGRGSLRGFVQLVEADAPPASWALELVPSRFFAGAEGAVGRTLRFTDEAAAGDAPNFDFRVDDLAFGAYDVRPVADGFNGTWVSVVIDKVNRSPFVNLALRRAGFLEGQLVDSEGFALEGVDVVLVGQADTRSIETQSDTFGRYRFDRVPDGLYELVIGPPESPLAPSERIEFRAPSMTLPATVLDGLATVVVQVIDDAGVPVVDARITGSSTGGGRIDAVTDATGQATLLHLGPGRVRLGIAHAEHGSERSGFDLGGDAEKVVTIQLPRRR
ncbi:MAG: carboxypeptidase-like regulatory domain-containing protein [Planctomycetota bacterium]